MSTPPCPINWPKKRAELSAVQKALSQAQTRIETLAEQVIKAQAERNTAREASARMASPKRGAAGHVTGRCDRFLSGSSESRSERQAGD